MKRSARKLARYSVTIPTRRIGYLKQLGVDCESWVVRQLEVSLENGSRLVMSSNQILGVDSAVRRLTVSLRGVFNTVDELEIGEPRIPELMGTSVVPDVPIVAPDGAQCRLYDLVIDDHSWRVDYLLATTGEGVRYPIPVSDVEVVDTRTKRIHLSTERSFTFSSE
jgi:hypothetical protein